MGVATRAHPSFGMTPTKTLRSVFSWSESMESDGTPLVKVLTQPLCNLHDTPSQNTGSSKQLRFATNLRTEQLKALDYSGRDTINRETHSLITILHNDTRQVDIMQACKPNSSEASVFLLEPLLRH